MGDDEFDFGIEVVSAAEFDAIDAAIKQAETKKATGAGPVHRPRPSLEQRQPSRNQAPASLPLAQQSNVRTNLQGTGTDQANAWKQFPWASGKQTNSVSGGQSSQVGRVLAPAVNAVSAPPITISFEVLSVQVPPRLAVVFKYSATIIAAVKSIPGSQYAPDKRQWSIPSAEYENCLKALRALKNLNLKIIEIPKNVMTSFTTPDTAGIVTSEEVDRLMDAIPGGLNEALLAFQREGVRYCFQHNSRALIGDEMGLGKTLQALAVVSVFKEEWPVLVIAPSSMKLPWVDAFGIWLGIDAQDIRLIPNGKERIPMDSDPFKVYIISYDLTTKLQAQLEAKSFKIIICDESHFIKNRAAQRTKAIVPLLQCAKYSVLLTGTPALSRPEELFAQLNALRPDVFKSMKQYGDRYCGGPQGRFRPYDGASNLSELNRLLEQKVMIRRLKKDVLRQLPAKRRQRVLLDLGDKLTNDLKKMRKKLDAEFEKQKAGSGPGGGYELDLDTLFDDMEADNELDMADNVGSVTFMQYYQQTGINKINAVNDYVDSLVSGGVKFLLFAHHMNVMDGVEAFCIKNKIKYMRIDGSTKPEVRFQLVKQFQESDDLRIAILSITAAGTGLTLTAASTVVFAELTWTPSVLMQCEDRVHRIGQHNSVNIHYLVARDSADDLVWSLIESKMKILGQTLNRNQQKDMDVEKEVKRGRTKEAIASDNRLRKQSSITNHVDGNSKRQKYA